MKWVFKVEARAEFPEIYRWHDDRSLSAGDRFIEEFNQIVEEICENPNRWPPFYSPRFRKALMDKFPYQIIYRVSEVQITIMIIRHEKRREAYGLDRL